MHHLLWRLSPRPDSAALAALGPMPALAALLLARRGLTERGQVRAYLEAATAAFSCDPFALPDMELAVRRLQESIRRGELVAVYGDFDADGITATAVLTEGLASLGGRTIPYIPHRLREGHGLRAEAIQDLARRGASLLVAADCGTTSRDEIAGALRLGLDVIVADHHVPPPEPSPALALVNPLRSDSLYPSPELASVGLAVKLVEALYSAEGRAGPPEPLYELVALGTVADVAPLVHENRYLVKRGLAALERTQRPGLRALLALAGAGPVNEDTIGFVLGPRINAAGRLEHAQLAYDLLAARSDTEAAPLAARLEALNRQRQEHTRQILEEAEAQWQAQEQGPVIMVSSPRFPAGLVGLAAARLSQDYHRPAIVMEVGPSEVRGSGRSIDEFDLIQCLHERPELFLRYGGHAKAAGFAIAASKLPDLTSHLRRRAEELLAGVELRPSVQIEAEITFSELTPRIIRLLKLLAPFGEGNRPPVFLTRGASIVGVRALGGEGRHLGLRVRENGVVWDALGFGLGGTPLAAGRRADLVYTVSNDTWNGQPRLRLNLLDARPAD